MTKFTFSGVKRKIKALRGLTAEGLENFFGKRVLGRDLSELIVYLFIAVYTIVFSHFTILKHYAFRSYAWDFGNYHQALWTTLNEGRLFYFTPELYVIPSGNFLGLHFSPILFLVLPVYAIHQTPETLFVFQSFIIALGALPLYWFAWDSLSSRLAAVGFSIAYLLYPLLHGANWFDFHTQCFLPLFFFLALYYLKSEKWIKYFTFIILALSVAESVSVVVVFIGFYTLWVYRRIIFATLKQKALSDRRILIPLITMTLAISWFLVARLIQSTFFSIDPKFSGFYRAVDYWSVLGIQDDPMMMPLHVILNPLKVFNALAYDAYLKLIFIVIIFSPLLFLSFRSSILLITLAWLGPALLSNRQDYYVLGIHYPLYIIPFVFLAAVDGTKKYIPTLNITELGTLVRNLLVLGVIFSLFTSPLSPLLTTMTVPIPYFSEYPVPTITEHTVTLQRIVALVPPNASVLTQNNIFPHFSSRLNAYVVPLPHAVDYAPEEMKVYVDQLLNKSEYVLVDLKTDMYGASDQIFNRVWRMDFGLYAAEDGIYLFKRGYAGEPVL
ncbi:MAG: DUF2079 domain-containing protein [Candidatus Bathyarchaeaceae archaeon]